MKVKAAETAGLAGPCSVWLDAAIASDSIMGVAMDAGLQAAIANAAKLAKARLATVRPWWALALDEQLTTHSDTELFVAEDPDSATVLTGKNGAWLSADSYAPKLSATQLESLIARRLFASVSATTSAKRVRMGPVGGEAANWLQAQSIASFSPA